MACEKLPWQIRQEKKESTLQKAGKVDARQDSGVEREKLTEKIIAQMMAIAFADLTDYIEFGCKKATKTDRAGKPVVDEAGETEKKDENYIRFKPSGKVDGTILEQAYLGSYGPVVKLPSRTRALEWLMRNIIDDGGGLQRAVGKEGLSMKENKGAPIHVLIRPELHAAMEKAKGLEGGEDH